MEGYEQIILEQPPDRLPVNAAGETDMSAVLKEYAWHDDFSGRDHRRITFWRVYAVRRDRGGREALFADARGGNWNTRFEVRRTSALEAISEKWSLADVRGNRYDIEAIDDAAVRRNRHWWIYAVRRVTRS